MPACGKGIDVITIILRDERRKSHLLYSIKHIPSQSELLSYQYITLIKVKDMNPWFTFWLKDIYLPLSGAVEQEINARNNFLSPQIELNFAGNQAIEKEIVSHVASYGTQLGLLAKVVLELSKNSKSKEVAELTKLLDKVETVKKRIRRI